MIIVHITGGVGNQMFQYALGYSLSQTLSYKLKLDISEFDDYDLHLRNYELGLFDIEVDVATMYEVQRLKEKKKNILAAIFRKLKINIIPIATGYYQEPHYHFDENIFNIQGDTYIQGYWQSEKYFKEYRDDVLKQFTLKKEIHTKTKEYLQKINKTEAISLHVRRGDYVSSEHSSKIHGTCSLDYYKNAIIHIEKSTKNPHFFIFSDDLDWAKANLTFIDNKTFVELDKNIPDQEEMYLMSKCQHNIIANSSFSWWGAWLNQNADKIVIAPKQWFLDSSMNIKDLIPDDWVCL